MVTNSYSLDFNGSTQYGRKATPSSLFGLTQMTVETWFMADSLITTLNLRGMIASVGTRAGPAEQVLQLYTFGDGTNTNIAARMGYVTNGSKTLIGDTNLSVSTWYHAVASYDGSNFRLYLGTVGADDAEDVTATAVSSVTFNTPSSSHDSSFLGAMGITAETDIGDYFNGKIDELRYWNVARSLSDINSNRKKQITSHANLLSYYSMNEGTGSTAADDPGTNDFTLTNSPTWSATVPFANYETDAVVKDIIGSGFIPFAR